MLVPKFTDDGLRWIIEKNSYKGLKMKVTFQDKIAWIKTFIEDEQSHPGVQPDAYQIIVMKSILSDMALLWRIMSYASLVANSPEVTEQKSKKYNPITDPFKDLSETEPFKKLGKE